MGFAQHTQETSSNISSGSNILSNFYRLNIDADAGSPQDRFQLPSGEVLNGRSEIVWFLNSFDHIPVVNYHGMASIDKFLCSHMFPGFDTCPACDKFEEITDQYEGEERKKMPVKARKQTAVVPVYIPRRAREGHIYTSQRSQSKVLPIYWFSLDCTAYIPECDAQFERLKQSNAQYPISIYPYKIFLPPRGTGRNEYYFQPVTYDPASMGIYTDHPILKAPWIPDMNNPSQKNWDQDYYDMMEYLPLLQYLPYKHADGRLETYGGFYETAKQYMSLTKNWPLASEKLEVQQPAQPTPIQQQPHQVQQGMGQDSHGFPAVPATGMQPQQPAPIPQGPAPVTQPQQYPGNPQIQYQNSGPIAPATSVPHQFPQQPYA